ncbi:hypothetical protein ACM66B_003860 [Microbotryomycetes sp. NB124-2]
MACSRLISTAQLAARRYSATLVNSSVTLVRLQQPVSTRQQRVWQPQQRQTLLQRRSTSSSTSRPKTCPACSAQLPDSVTPLCPQCSSLLPPPSSSTSSFELFNVPPQYSIDTSALKRTFLQYQQKVHPDLFSGQGDKEQWARVWSARVNDAYKVLAEGRARGEYLLSLSGVDIGEAEGVTDPELLMEVMETREALEDADTEEDVTRIRESNKQNVKQAFEQLSTVLDCSNPDLEEAKTLLVKLKYYENIEGVCREWQPGKRIELQH